MKKLHLKLELGQRLLFTSDLHLGHRNVIKFCNRPFENEKEMNEKLIENWNSVVDEKDIIFVLGDTFWFNDSHVIKKVLNKLNGIIYIIPGNHDNFESYHRIADNPRIILCDDRDDKKDAGEQIERQGDMEYVMEIIGYYGCGYQYADTQPNACAVDARDVIAERMAYEAVVDDDLLVEFVVQQCQLFSQLLHFVEFYICVHNNKAILFVRHIF